MRFPSKEGSRLRRERKQRKARDLPQTHKESFDKGRECTERDPTKLVESEHLEAGGRQVKRNNVATISYHDTLFIDND